MAFIDRALDSFCRVFILICHRVQSDRGALLYYHIA